MSNNIGFTPNTTPTPNWLYNGEMKKMNETQLKVVLLITRKTLGWFDPKTEGRKEQDYISQSQFMEFTGKSHTAIAIAIQSSVKNGWIIARDKNGNLCETSEKRRRRKVWYQLGSIFTKKISKQQSGQDKNLSNKVAKKSNKSKQHSCTHLSNKVDNTKETITKENTCENIFSQEGYLSSLAGLKRDTKRHIRIIGIYLTRLFERYESQPYSNGDEKQEVIKRHCKAATKVGKFGNDKIIKAMDKAFEKVGEESTLETVYKYLTK